MSTDQDILDRITELQTRDLPTHGGRTLAYVYDSGVAGLISWQPPRTPRPPM